MRKELWSPDEDEKLKQYIQKHGHHSWTEVSIKAGLQRCGKSCRLRWLNYLRPGLRRDKFSNHEVRLVMDLHKIYGNRWSKIASYMKGRTDNDVKNLWNSQIRRHHQSKLNNNHNHMRTLPNKSLAHSISVANSTNYVPTQEIKEEQEDLVTNYQVLNMQPRIFAYSSDPRSIDVSNTYGIKNQHESYLLEHPIEKLLFSELNLNSMHSVEVNENIHVDRKPKLEVDQESSMFNMPILDKLTIKRFDYSSNSLNLTSIYEDQVHKDENINHFSYAWNWYNYQDQSNDFMVQNGMLIKVNMANYDDGTSSINSSHYQQIPPLPPLEFNPSYMVSPIIDPIDQHDTKIFHYHDIEDMSLIYGN